MIPRKYVLNVLAGVLMLVFASGCQYGDVDQGRTVAFDKEKGLVTIIRDVKHDTLHPEYTHLPPVVYKIPKDPKEMGPEPVPGHRIMLDTNNRRVKIFDPVEQNFRIIDYTLIDQKDNVRPNDPLVAGKTFPIIDREKKTITIYSSRQRVLVTFSLPDEYFELPDITWVAGDELRIYFEEEGQAHRLMNVTKTDIYKK